MKFKCTLINQLHQRLKQIKRRPEDFLKLLLSSFDQYLNSIISEIELLKKYQYL